MSQSAQDFVDALNHKEFPKAGYRLVHDGERSYWEWPHKSFVLGVGEKVGEDGLSLKPLKRYPANENTRMLDRQAR